MQAACPRAPSPVLTSRRGRRAGTLRRVPLADKGRAPFFVFSSSTNTPQILGQLLPALGDPAAAARAGGAAPERLASTVALLR